MRHNARLLAVTEVCITFVLMTKLSIWSLLKVSVGSIPIPSVFWFNKLSCTSASLASFWQWLGFWVISFSIIKLFNRLKKRIKLQHEKSEKLLCVLVTKHCARSIQSMFILLSSYCCIQWKTLSFELRWQLVSKIVILLLNEDEKLIGKTFKEIVYTSPSTFPRARFKK